MCDDNTECGIRHPLRAEQQALDRMFDGLTWRPPCDDWGRPATHVEYTPPTCELCEERTAYQHMDIFGLVCKRCVRFIAERRGGKRRQKPRVTRPKPVRALGLGQLSDVPVSLSRRDL